MQNIPTISFVVKSSAPISLGHSFGLQVLSYWIFYSRGHYNEIFHSLGLTNRFTPPRRSDPLVLTNLLRKWQDLSFLTSGIPILPFQAEFTIFTHASTQGLGAQMVDSQISGFKPVQTTSSTSTVRSSRP